MSLDDKILKASDALEALYFLTQGLDGAGQDAKDVRENYKKLPKKARVELLKVMHTDIHRLREHYGAIASNEYYVSVQAEIRDAGSAFAYIGKLEVGRYFFSHYENALARWPHVKDHAFVVFDPQKGMLNQLFEMDGQLFHDSQFLLQKVRNIQGTAASQRELPIARRRIIHSVLRSVVAELFTFMEAYLNGIAFDCFHRHHDQLNIGDHDLLSEWNSEARRTRFVAFDQKVFRYPVICARAEGREVDLSGFRQAHRIVQNGKELRDAITHPSAHYNAGGEQQKVTLLAGLTLPALESLYRDICDYVRFVEEGIGHDVTQSAPWLFDELGFQYGRDDTI
jgi:hypothetical protein